MNWPFEDDDKSPVWSKKSFIESAEKCFINVKRPK